MRALKGTFPRLLTSLSLDAAQRSRLLHLCVGLFITRAWTVGLNQIQSTFMPELMRRASAMEVEEMVNDI